MKRFVFAIATLGIAAVFACSSSTQQGVVQPVVDAAPGDDDAGATDAATASDTGTGADGGSTSTCEGACKTTSLVGDFGGKVRTLVRAQHGTQTGDAGSEFHVEAHLGGAPECPSQNSPSPDYTVIVTSIPRGRTGKLTEADGITSAFFDFKGDLALPPIAKSTKVEVTIVAVDSATPPAWVAMDVSVTFPEGTVKGHLYAAHCTSLDD